MAVEKYRLMGEISFGGVLVDDTNIIHDSTREEFRAPLGAVSCGTEVELSLQVAGVYIERATLCVLRDGVVEKVEMASGDRDKGDGSFCLVNETKRTVPGIPPFRSHLYPVDFPVL